MFEVEPVKRRCMASARLSCVRLRGNCLPGNIILLLLDASLSYPDSDFTEGWRWDPFARLAALRVFCARANDGNDASGAGMEPRQGMGPA